MKKKKQKKDPLRYLLKAIGIMQTQFYLEEWEILVSQEVFGDDFTTAKCHLWSDVRIAEISFCSDSMIGNPKKNNPEKWLQTVIHEMVHVRLAPISEGVVQRTRNDHRDPGQFWDTFVSELEPTVDLLSHIIFDQWKGWPL